jgi:putative transposase
MSKVFHYTFSTYNRKKILVDYIANDLLGIFQTICQEKGFTLVCQNILIEHVHLLINKRNNDNNEYVMKMIKGISARRIFEKYPSNRFEFRKLWGRGYRAYEIKNEDDLKRAINYINGQKIGGMDKRISRIGNRDVQSQVSMKD